MEIEYDDLYQPHQDQFLVGTRKPLLALAQIPRQFRLMAWNHLLEHHPEKARSLELLEGRKQRVTSEGEVIEEIKGDPMFLELKSVFGAEVVLFATDLPQEVREACRQARIAERNAKINGGGEG